MKSHFILLGTGSSLGVPIVGCRCSVCTSSNPKNKRLRSSALIRLGEKKLLIDAGPDIRTQALIHKIEQVDGFFLTHAHYDHLGGFDDLKPFHFTKKEKLPCLMLPETFNELKLRYHYFFDESEGSESPFFSWHFLEGDFGKTEFQGISLEYMSYAQQGMKVAGLKIGNLAYVSDIKTYSDELIERILGVDILIVSALRHAETNMHFNVEEAIDFSKKIQAKRTIFTHISHDLEYETMQTSLPSGVEMGYDGMDIVFKSE